MQSRVVICERAESFLGLEMPRAGGDAVALARRGDAMSCRVEGGEMMCGGVR